MDKIKVQWENNGIILQSFEKGQEEKYYNDCFSFSDPEVNRLTGSDVSFSHDQVVNYYKRIIEDSSRYDFIIIDSKGKFIGESVINEIDWELRSANFRIVLFDSKNCSQGIGSWVIQQTLDFAFDTLKLHRLELEVFSFNPRAKHCYEKAGFQLEGIKKDAIKNGYEYGDIYIMAILEDEWRNRHE